MWRNKHITIILPWDKILYSGILVGIFHLTNNCIFINGRIQDQHVWKEESLWSKNAKSEHRMKTFCASSFNLCGAFPPHKTPVYSALDIWKAETHDGNARKCKAVAWLCVFLFNQRADDTRAKSISRTRQLRRCLVWELNEINGESRKQTVIFVRSLTVRRRLRWRRRPRNKKRKHLFGLFGLCREHTAQSFASLGRYIIWKYLLSLSLTPWLQIENLNSSDTGKGSTLRGSRKTHTQKLCTCVRAQKFGILFLLRSCSDCVGVLYLRSARSQKVDIFYSWNLRRYPSK
jgi:hypothetical protein